jgi:hypothetical protein
MNKHPYPTGMPSKWRARVDRALVILGLLLSAMAAGSLGAIWYHYASKF